MRAILCFALSLACVSSAISASADGLFGSSKESVLVRRSDRSDRWNPYASKSNFYSSSRNLSGVRKPKQNGHDRDPGSSHFQKSTGVRKINKGIRRLEKKIRQEESNSTGQSFGETFLRGRRSGLMASVDAGHQRVGELRAKVAKLRQEAMRYNINANRASKQFDQAQQQQQQQQQQQRQRWLGNQGPQGLQGEYEEPERMLYRRTEIRGRRKRVDQEAGRINNNPPSSSDRGPSARQKLIIELIERVSNRHHSES